MKQKQLGFVFHWREKKAVRKIGFRLWASGQQPFYLMESRCRLFRLLTAHCPLPTEHCALCNNGLFLSHQQHRQVVASFHFGGAFRTRHVRQIRQHLG